MPDELYVPQSEPLKRLFAKHAQRSWIATGYLVLGLIVHIVILLRSWYILKVYIYGRGLTFADWPSNQQSYFFASILGLALIGGHLFFLRRTMLVYVFNTIYIIYHYMDPNGTQNLLEIGGSNDVYIFFGFVEFFWLWIFFIGVHWIVFPSITVLIRLVRWDRTGKG